MMTVLLRSGVGMAALLFCGCASLPAVETAPLWPFQQFNVRTRLAGSVSAYFSRPAQPPQRMVIVVQAPLCRASARLLQLPDLSAISTSGVLWDQFKEDSAFLQFERPGVATEDSAATALEICNAQAPGRMSAQQWQWAAEEALAAIRQREALETVPVIYIGVAEGASVAAELAVADAGAELLVLMSAAQLNPELDAVLAALQSTRAAVDVAGSMRMPVQPAVSGSGDEPVNIAKTMSKAPRLPVLIAHGAADRQAPMESALSLFATLGAKRQPVTMLLFERLGHDFGLSDGVPECFELAMQSIAAEAITQAARNKASASPAGGSMLSAISCHPEIETTP